MSLKSVLQRKGRTTTGGRTTRKKRGQKETSISIEELVAQAPPKKEKVGMLTRIGNVLSAFEPGGEIATLLRTGDPIRAGKQYVSELGRGLKGLRVY